MQLDVAAAIGAQAFHTALERIGAVVRHGNRYVEDNAPWQLAKAGDAERLDTVLYNLVETLRLVALQLMPFMPTKAAAMLDQIMGEGAAAPSLRSHGGWGPLKPGHACAKPSPAFPRLES